MRAGNQYALDIILVARRLSLDALAAAVLRAEGLGRGALDVAEMRHGDRHFLFLNDVVEVDVVQRLRDFGTARIGKTRFYVERFVLHNLQKLMLVT